MSYYKLQYHTNLAGFLLKAGQGDLTSPGGWWRMRNPIRYLDDQISMGDPG